MKRSIVTRCVLLVQLMLLLSVCLDAQPKKVPPGQAKKAAKEFLQKRIAEYDPNSVLVAGSVLGSDSVCTELEPEQLIVRQFAPEQPDSLYREPLVYLVGFADVPVGMITRSQAEGYIQNAQLAAYRASGGRTPLGYRVLDWIRTPRLSTTCSLDYAFLDSVARARDGIDPPAWVDKFYITSCGSNSGSTPTFISASGIYSLVYISGSYIARQFSWTHENFHRYRLKHANRFSKSGFPDTTFLNVEYGESANIMGYWGDRDPVSAVRAYFAWWTPDASITLTQTAELTLLPTESVTPGLKVIKVPRAWSAKLIDASYPAASVDDYVYVAYDSRDNGINLHVTAPWCERGIYCFAGSYLLTFDGQIAIAPGQTVYDGRDRVSYTCVSAGVGEARVRITFGAEPPPPPPPPPPAPVEYSWDCKGKNCQQRTDAFGRYKSLEDCQRDCAPPGKKK
jgi:hypothetical protein